MTIPRHSPLSTALVLSARRGQHGQGRASIGRGLYVERLTAGSTTAARKCLLITCKIIIPPPDSGDPPDGPPYFLTHELHLRTQGSASEKKQFAPLTAGTHQLHLCMQGSASGQKNVSPSLLGPTSYIFARKEVRPKKNDSPPDCWDPPATSSHARKCLTIGTHLVEAYVALSFWSRTCTYIYTGRCRGTHTCCSRGAHVACTRTYSGQGARK